MEASWYKFWKIADISGGFIEDYIWYDPGDADTWIDIDIEHEVEHHGGVKYGFEKINMPPFQWLKKELEYKMEEKKRLQKWIDRVSDTLTFNWCKKSEEDVKEE